MTHYYSYKIKLRWLIVSCICVFCGSLRAHVVEQFYAAYAEDTGVLEVSFDVGYAMPETRDDASMMQPRRAWLVGLSDARYAELRREAELYIRSYIELLSDGAVIEYGVHFSDFDDSPPSFPSLLNEGAYFTVQLIPEIGSDDSLSVKIADRGFPNLVIARERGGVLVFENLDEEVTELSLRSKVAEDEVDSSSGVLARFGTMIKLGFRHVIPEGGDHILFIIGICLLATGVKNLLLQSLVFTLSHSLTMALVISGYFPVYQYGVSRWIEPLIALSICFLAVEALLQKGRDKATHSKYRFVIIGTFGLVHGLGFAGSLGGSLQAIVKDASDWVSAVIWSNVGIELAQAVLILVVYGGLHWLVRSPLRGYANVVRATLALLVGLVGLYWFLERTLI